MDPAGVFATTFDADAALVRTRRQWLALAVFALFLIVLPWLVGPRLVAICTVMLISSVVAVGLQINTGYAGQINLGQAAFMGVGAYAAGAASLSGLPFWLAIPVGGVAAAVFGFAFGLSAVRIKGFYLALTTIAAQSLFHFSILNLPWFGGSNGVTLAPASLFGYELSSDRALYYLSLAFATVMICGAFGIVRGRHGRAFVAVRVADEDVVFVPRHKAHGNCPPANGVSRFRLKQCLLLEMHDYSDGCDRSQ